MQTTFMMDFRIADHFGESAIRDTYKRAFREWKNDTVYITELSLVLNWQIWRHWENGNDEIARVYDELWRKNHSWCLDHLKGDDARYYFEVTD